VHWARLEASALGGLIAACPTWKRRERRGKFSIDAGMTVDAKVTVSGSEIQICEVATGKFEIRYVQAIHAGRVECSTTSDQVCQQHE